MQMVKEAEEERANQLVQQMKTFQISSMEEEFAIEWYALSFTYTTLYQLLVTYDWLG